MTVKFFCDTNIIRLAKWLRFAGFDVLTRKELSKIRIDNLCVKDRRVFITRSKHKDIKLFRARVETVCFEDIYSQIKFILSKYPVNHELISTRCIKCNVKLRIVVGSEEKYCPRCGRKYWEGTHFHNMMKVISP